MTRAFVTQTSFTAGEIDPRLLGRTDLRAYGNGARRLRNVVVETTGGIRRRPGLRHVAPAAGSGRLIAVELGAAGSFLLAFSDFQVDVHDGATKLATLVTPYPEAQLARLVWAQRQNQLVLTHPDVPPQLISRSDGGVWTIEELGFASSDIGLSAAPFARFVEPDVALQGDATSGAVNLVASAGVFTANHLGGMVRIKGVQIDLTNIVSSTQATGLIRANQDPMFTGATTDWDELAFSEARGWAATVTFHQSRMVFGGSRDLPNALWMSKTGRFSDFDLSDGLDDEAIEFRLASADLQAIRALVPGRHLQVFTTAGEWIVTGTPLTPTNIQVEQQSHVGSPEERYVPPRDVDGATLFASRNGREIREFLFTNTELAYQSADLALLARHLVQDPVDQVFDQRRRLFLIVMADGSLATIAIYRNADIAAWSLLTTAGSFLSVAAVGGETFFLVERDGAISIERFDDNLQVDAGLSQQSSVTTTVWSGFDHLEGQTLAVVADGQAVEPATVIGGEITLVVAAQEMKAGLPFLHEIEPMPAAPALGRGIPLDVAYRPVRLTLRVFETQSVRIDTGDGLREIPLHRIGEGPQDRGPAPFSGDLSLRALGWRRGADQPPWRIEQDAPLPSTILSVTTEVKVNE
jgi:hypothetical protein